MKVRLIGDIHANTRVYSNIIKDVDRSLQLGDVGFGFFDNEDMVNVFKDMPNEGINHRFIRGNHDDPEKFKQFGIEHGHSVPDGPIETSFSLSTKKKNYTAFYMGGATSIDWRLRIPGVSWWPDEQLSVPQLEEMINRYNSAKPDILLTHECPENFAREVMIPEVNGLKREQSNTRDAIQVMHDVHAPKLHVFAHWHKFVMREWNGTLMICLPEFGYIDVDFNNLDSEIERLKSENRCDIMTETDTLLDF